MFNSYFGAPDAALAQFYATAYLFRHNAANRLYHEYQAFVNSVLLKLKAIRVFSFNRFTQDILLPKIGQLEASLRHLLDEILNLEVCFKASDIIMDRIDFARQLKRKELPKSQDDHRFCQIAHLQP